VADLYVWAFKIGALQHRYDVAGHVMGAYMKVIDAALFVNLFNDPRDIRLPHYRQCCLGHVPKAHSGPERCQPSQAAAAASSQNYRSFYGIKHARICLRLI